MKKMLFIAALAAAGIMACKDKAPVVAKVGSAEITQETVNQKLAAMPPAYQNFAATPLGKKQFVDSIVRETIMVESAKQAGIAKKPEYSEALKEFEESQKRQLEDYKNGLLIESYLREIQPTITAADADIEAYYKDNKESFDNPVEYTARHILTSDKAAAEAALDELQKGAKFDEVVKKYSQDGGSAENGGLIGPFKRGELVPEFEKVALELKDNEMSGVVETQYGYHIILKVSQKAIPAVSFEQAAPLIKRIVEKEKFDKWFESKKQSLGVSVNYDALKDNVSQPAQEDEEYVEVEETETAAAQ
ncbi:MAG: peptidylprolyl isomerase [Endomicrobium sp.]|jgi:parvulin-like peptidyl-prolyl isomerase|nr:peptidylprolyl isomerase [Endomicrobium sp.]